MLGFCKNYTTFLYMLPNTVEMCVVGLPSSTQQLRFRKPKHLGRAPSKDQSYFKKYYPTNKDLEKSLPLYNNYNIMLKSIVAAFQEEIVLKESKKTTESDSWNEEAHHMKCMNYNEIENTKFRKARFERLEEIRKSQQSQQISRTCPKKLEKFRDEVNKIVAESENWLTLDNMEEKITEAVDNPISFNFGINMNGKITRRTALVLSPDHEVYETQETATA